MNPPGPLARLMALIGTIIVWLPFILMLATSVTGSARRGFFRMDYLIPAELFPLILLGGALILGAAWRSRRRRKLIAWAGALAVLSLVASQALAVVTGLASGRTEPTGTPWFAVVVLLAIYVLSALTIAIAGVLLVRDLRAATR